MTPTPSKKNARTSSDNISPPNKTKPSKQSPAKKKRPQAGSIVGFLISPQKNVNTPQSLAQLPPLPKTPESEEDELMDYPDSSDSSGNSQNTGKSDDKISYQSRGEVINELNNSKTVSETEEDSSVEQGV